MRQQQGCQGKCQIYQGMLGFQGQSCWWQQRAQRPGAAQWNWRQGVNVCAQGGRRGSGLSTPPCLVFAGKSFPVVGGMWEIIRGKDGSRGDCQELAIGHGKGCMGKLALHHFQHCDEFGNAVGVIVIVEHVRGEAKEFAWVETPAVCVKVAEELLGRNSGVEGVRGIDPDTTSWQRHRG